MILPVILAPDHRLITPCEEVYEVTDDILTLLDDLFDTMTAHDGVGLSACQVGRMLQVCVIQINEEDDILEMINPRLIAGDGSTLDVEGCLSFPYLYGTVERFENIVVEYYDREGDLMELKASDYLARCIQHEVDHLNGILFDSKIKEKIPYDTLDKWMEEHLND